MIYEIVQAYFKFDRKIAEMKKAVGANTDEEMSAVFAKCTRIGEKYYVSPDCVLNFDSLLVYPRSAVLCVEPHEHSRRSRPGIRITYGPDLFDYMYFSSFESRDRALADFAHAAHPF